MGEKDTIDKKIEKNNDVFADIFNTLLFKEEVIKPQQLKPGVTNVVVEVKDGVENRYRDECKLYEDSSLVVVSLGIENQTKKDNLMPVRVMGYDYGEYLGQLINVKNVKLPYLYPSITLILNYSDTRWGKPRSLKECIRYNEKLWPYVNDYKMYVVDMNFLSDEEIGSFKSDLRGILTLLKDIREGKLEPTKYDFSFDHPEDAYRFISTYLQDERLEEIVYSSAEKEGKENGTVCKAFDDLINKGHEEGLKEGKISMLKQLIDSGVVSMEEGAKQMGVTRDEFESMMNKN